MPYGIVRLIDRRQPAIFTALPPTAFLLRKNSAGLFDEGKSDDDKEESRRNTCVFQGSMTQSALICAVEKRVCPCQAKVSLLLIAGRSRFWFGYMNFLFCSDYYGGKALLPLFGRNIKSARYRYGFLQGSPFRLDIIALPFGQAWGQIPIPAGRCRVKRKPPPAFCGMPHIFRLHQSRSRAGAGSLQGAGRYRGAPQAFRPAGETDGEAVEPAPPAGGGLPAAPPGGSAHARGHSPSRSNRKSCGLVILRREQYPIRCGSTTVSSSPCRFLSAHK